MNAPLLPAAVAYDAAGNLYFADRARNQVLEATLAGALVVIAGTGTQGYSGDGGPATEARLNEPQGIAVGSDGTVYLADTGNARVRAAKAGTITTVAGTGVVGGGGDGGLATLAQLRSPTALAVAAGGVLLVCDTADQRVRAIAGGQVVPFAGTGMQGYAGDGGAASAAELDSPSGIAVAPDGRVFLADTHNRRVRVVGTNGVISTFAGTGVQGSTGDGGAATQATLASPRGVAVMPDGSVAIADGQAQRVRLVSPAGTMATLVGDGVEGAGTDGAMAAETPLRQPRALAVTPLGQLAVADTLNGTVRVLIAGGQLFQPAAWVAGRLSTVQVLAGSSQPYGQAAAAVTVSGVAGTPQGVVTLQDGGTPVASGNVNAGSATVSLPMLDAGMHALSASFGGDGLNPAAAAAAPVTVQVLPLAVTATAQAATMAFGAATPALTGSVSGVLAQDAGQVGVSFQVAGTPGAVGQYALVPTLTGARSGNYTVSLAEGSGQLQITPAGTQTLLGAMSPGYSGVPLTLAANVVANTSGMPTGSVQFVEGTTVLATGTLVHGSASAVFTPTQTGSVAVTAVYHGDGNYQASTSAAQMAAISVLPDFSVVASAGAAAVNAGGSGTYSLTVAGAPGPFTGVVVLSAAGLPAGSSIVFSPVQVVPGSSAAVVTATVQTTAATAALRPEPGGGVVALCAGCFGLCFWRFGGAARRRRALAAVVGSLVMGSLLTGSLLTLSGCGARTVGEGTGGALTQTYTLQMTGTSTNLLGAVVSHTAPVTLTIQQ